MQPVPPALKRFIWDIQSMVELADSEREILMIGRDLMVRLVAADDWLPAAFATAEDAPFRQFQLYADAMERFCVVATVIGAGQSLPLCREPVWDITGVLRGGLTRQAFALPEGAPPVAQGAARLLTAGMVATFSPAAGAAGLAMACPAGPGGAIAIQVHGGELAGLERTTVDAEGRQGRFTTRYANPPEAPAYDILTIQTQIVD
ncbi:hypothetical protein ACI7BZ_11170 [Xanthobacter sp. AM11]|uniref:cysteine dioxygenase family protein n=1 Tax=Xanthobacter sp. AM11 TaxID=3380643 RepID=UPI0039BF5A37